MSDVYKRQSQNCVHYLYTDFGAYGIRVTSVPFYANSKMCIRDRLLIKLFHCRFLLKLLVAYRLGQVLLLFIENRHGIGVRITSQD